MSWRKKADLNKSYVKKSFANWLAQICVLLMPKFFYMIAGRGSAKTTDLLCERFLEIAYDMPGAPAVWVSDTYTNLHKNVLQTLLDALESKGYRKGIHYVLGEKPPEFTKAERDSIDPAFREHFWKPYNSLVTYKNTLVFYTGFNVTFGSLDSPASLAGRSYVHVFGDEVKYFKESKIANLLKAIRGYKVKYGKSVFYRGHTFTTDMPNTANIGEYDWILKIGSRMRKKGLMLVLKAAFIMNEALNELLAAKESRVTEEIIKKQRTYERWVERWTTARQSPDASTLFYIASSYVNVDVLGIEWFDDSSSSELGDHNTAVLSMRAGMESGDRFYASLLAKHFYTDGIDPFWAEKFGITDTPDCRILKYLNLNKALDGGMDFGNMMSLCIAQDDGKKNYRVLKFHYVLTPEWFEDLSKEFRAFYEPHRQKVLNLYYDRAANNYKLAKQDLASQFKKAMEEVEVDGKQVKTGWKVVLHSEGQGNIGKNEEFLFMQQLLSGTNRALPNVLIDMYNCKPLKCSLEVTKQSKNAKGQIEKDKRSEKLPVKRLPLESSNPSDSFKYLLMTKTNRKFSMAKKGQSSGSLSTPG
jgi:hypothetical protein